MRRLENQSQMQSWGQQGQICSRRRSCRRPTTASPRAQPCRGAAMVPQHCRGYQGYRGYRGCRSRERGAELGGGWRRQRHSPGSTHPPQITGGFAVTLALGWQRDSRTAAGQRDGSQPRWRLERSGGGDSSQFVCESLCCCWGNFFIIIILKRGGEERGAGTGYKGRAPQSSRHFPATMSGPLA